MKFNKQCTAIGLPEDVAILRLPRPRFTVRRLMLVVAVAGLAIGGGMWVHNLSRLSGYYAARARKHRTIELAMRTTAWFKSRADHHKSVALKYDQASRYPWLSVEPDPPEP